MVIVVRVELIYNICKVYLDDVIVPATSTVKLILNLTSVFEGFRKCLFGMTETKYEVKSLTLTDGKPRY